MPSTTAQQRTEQSTTEQGARRHQLTAGQGAQNAQDTQTDQTDAPTPEFAWEDPASLPSIRAPRGTFHRIASILEANPGRWARITVRTTQNRAQSVAGQLKKRFGMETTCRKTEDGQVAVFARYPEDQ